MGCNATHALLGPCPVIPAMLVTADCGHGHAKEAAFCRIHGEQAAQPSTKLWCRKCADGDDHDPAPHHGLAVVTVRQLEVSEEDATALLRHIACVERCGWDDVDCPGVRLSQMMRGTG